MKHKEDRRTLVFLVIFIIFQLSILVSWTSLSLLVLFILLILNCAVIVTTCLINHNHQHNSIFYHSQASRMVNFVISTIILAPASRLHAVHMFNHHAHFASDKDWTNYKIVPDEIKGLKRIFYYLWKASKNIATNRSSLSLPASLSKDLMFEKLWVRIYCLILVLINWKCFLFFLLPGSIIALLFMLLLNFENHENCDLQSTHRHSRSFLSRWENWIIFNNGYHGAHHLQPGLHWTKYPELHVKEMASNIDGFHKVEESTVSYLIKKYF